MARGQFLFVNKSQSSQHFGHCDAKEARDLQHFVQKGRPRARKKVLIAHSVTRATSVVLAASNQVADGTKNSTLGSDSLSNAKLSEEDRTEQHSPHQYWSPGPVSHLGNPIDPFATTSITIELSVKQLLDYYITLFHPTLWPNETQALRQGGYVFEQSVNTVVQKCIYDELMMYCLMAAAVCRMRYVDQLPLEAASQKEVGYMSKALICLQKRMYKAVTYTQANVIDLVNPMAFLAAAEAYRGDVEASSVHLQACHQLLTMTEQMVGDIDDRNLQGRLWMADLFISCVKLEKCFFDASEYDPGSVAVLDLLPQELQKVPNDLLQLGSRLSSHSGLSDELHTIVSQIQETYVIRQCLDTTAMTAARALDTTHWITKRNMAIRNRLLYPFRKPLNCSGAPANMLLQQAVRIALVQFTLLSMNITGRVMTVKLMNQYLRQHLRILFEQQAATTDAAYRDLILWLAVIGYSCALDGSADELWFADGCARIFVDGSLLSDDALGAWKYHQDLHERLQTMQRRFFYHHKIQGHKLEKLAAHIVIFNSSAASPS